MSEHEYIIDLAGAGSEEDVQEIVENSLPLPDYYGQNLDALYDVLTEMGDRWHIVIINRDLADDDVQTYIDDLIDTFTDASAVAADLTVECDNDRDGDFIDDEYE